MPDHVHFTLRVPFPLPLDLGHYIGIAKSQCSNAWWQVSPAMAGTPFFEDDFHALGHNGRLICLRPEQISRHEFALL